MHSAYNKHNAENILTMMNDLEMQLMHIKKVLNIVKKDVRDQAKRIIKR